MRAVVRWITLLVGIAIVAAMAWYGARALFWDEDPVRVLGSVAPASCGRGHIGVT